MTLHDILSRLDVKSGNNGRYMARCPCHNDQQASLSVGVGDDGRVLLHCLPDAIRQTSCKAWG